MSDAQLLAEVDDEQPAEYRRGAMVFLAALARRFHGDSID